MFLSKKIQIRLRPQELERLRKQAKRKDTPYYSVSHAIRSYIIRGLRQDETN